VRVFVQVVYESFVHHLVEINANRQPMGCDAQLACEGNCSGVFSGGNIPGGNMRERNVKIPCRMFTSAAAATWLTHRHTHRDSVWSGIMLAQSAGLKSPPHVHFEFCPLQIYHGPTF